MYKWYILKGKKNIYDADPNFDGVADTMVTRWAQPYLQVAELNSITYLSPSLTALK